MDCFCFLEWDLVSEGEEGEYMPKLPEEIPFLLLAGNPAISKWGIFECDLPEDFDFSSSEIFPVDQELDILLYSAKTYPPALANARDDFEANCKGLQNISREVFTEIFSKIVKQHLQLQRYKPYFLAEAMVDEEDYLIKGAFYWIIGFDPETNDVEWVSDDYFVYENQASDFGLDINKLRNVFSD